MRCEWAGFETLFRELVDTPGHCDRALRNRIVDLSALEREQ